MTTSRQHQEAHGIGQIEKQLEQQIEAAEEIQGASQVDREINAAANEHSSELDEIIVKQEK
ncbi:hypothetical protein [Paenibacillus arenilitoris]|uniref:Uncharacterized protein n=1 Tax=Paenibacillus arenilitoris TaxID=2772299 RepID=A0A927CMQ9_9BACL|nr:hypothetical protein [Paenibacillus arenilitoris]MBD2869423.1 hypothetical protein [Paenibacillus arenilitoris]